MALAVVVWGCGATLAAAQSAREQVVAQLRAEGRQALREGRFADALSSFQQAAFQATDPTVWLEVGDAADRLREDDAALDAYVRYLRARPNAPDRVEVAARVEVLRRVTGERSDERPAVAEAERRGLMRAPGSDPEGARRAIGETGRRGIFPAAVIVDAIRTRTHAGRQLSDPSAR